MNIYIVYKLTPRIIDEDEIVQVNGLFGNLKIGNTKNTLHYRYYDGIGGVFLMLEVVMELLDCTGFNSLWSGYEKFIIC